MRKIALVGAPETGKTRFARKLKKDHGFNVVDNIPEKFSRATDLLIGPEADYRVDIALFGIRFQEYYRARERGEDFVMTTTVLDSLAYTSLGFEYSEYDRVILAGQPEEDSLDANNFPFFYNISMITKLFRDSWLYDETVYFPVSSEVDPDSDYGKLDSYLRTVLDNHGVAYEFADAYKFPTR